MPDYDLYGLETRTFQQLCQALAVAEMGPGVVVFGDGRDGNRDAAFAGKVPYPSDSDPWNGSIVIQAKFRKDRFDDTQKAGTWVIRQLRQDLNKFEGAPRAKGTKKRSRPKPPDYYLAITNVGLTPVPETGSDAKVRALLNDYAQHLDLKGHDVWDGRKICALLDKHRDIAVSYAGFILTGDVLSEMHAYLQQLKPDFVEVMYDFLQAELIGSDQYARLSEAGSTVPRKPLAHVFVDLPVVNRPSDMDGQSQDEPVGFLSEVLEISKLRFDRSSVLDRREQSDPNDSHELVVTSGHLVLIGGPGQGKSTLGQFICQLFRAALLQDLDYSQLSAGAESTLHMIHAWCKRDNFALPTARRFPIRVELKTFADEIAKDHCNSLLDFIAQRVDLRSGRHIDRSDLGTWLQDYPWLLILDGLDEVPAAGNRNAILDEIGSFNAICASRGADVMIIATSRPQGYGEAFRSDLYWHRYLAPLSASRALSYAERLVEVCHADDHDKQEEVLRRLENAAAHENTRRLMLSPLQVTILAVLAELQGELPDDRWELFQEYYQTIYKRETQRNQALSPILSEYRVEISRAHERVGIELHMMNEIVGENDAYLNRSQLASILHQALSERFEHGDPKLDDVAKQIETAALERLVFLVSPEGEDVGFEIRSLQEFMAAKALTDGKDEQICNRLAAIAPYPFWRNVFLFAAGRCVNDRSHLTELIIGICTTLNNDSDNPACIHTHAGSLLALELLEDGTFRRSVKHTLALQELALALLDSPSESVHGRLARACSRNGHTTSLVQKSIRRSIETRRVDGYHGGWRTLLDLIEQGEDWAKPIAVELWPTETKERTAVLDTLPTWVPVNDSWLVEQKMKLAANSHPLSLIDSIAKEHRPKWLAAVEKLMGVRREIHVALQVPSRQKSCLAIRIARLGEMDSTWKALADTPITHGTWAILKSTAHFVAQPNQKTLATELSILAQNETFELRDVTPWWITRCPWPLAACLAIADNSEELLAIAQSVSRGKFGDTQDWKEHEEEWREEGIDLEAFVRNPSNDCTECLDSRMACMYLGRYISISNSLRMHRCEHLEHLIAKYSKMPESKQKSALRMIIVSGLSIRQSADPEVEFMLEQLPNPTVFQSFFEPSDSRFLPLHLVRTMPWPHPLPTEWIDTLDEMGLSFQLLSRVRRVTRTEEPHHFRFLENCIDAFLRSPQRTGLLKWIAGLVPYYPESTPIPKTTLRAVLDQQNVFVNEVLFLLFWQGELTSEEVDWVATTILDNLDDMQPTYRLFTRALLKHRGERWALDLVSQLLEKLPITEHTIRDDCHDWLEFYLSACPSPLQQSDVAIELGLKQIF
ncbi:NACHT domain-containing protein [Aeoliella sp.]|uniref:NACHT domain-containing protein n=1 Tax=Aeoliella sp. TaxID=2795800 RepID=UPI003CCB870D